MDFLKILRSIEELLYEVMSWLVFYPLTLWRSLRHPLRTMRYSDAEQAEKPEEQYLETLSPPLFLVLSILVAYVIEVAVGAPDPLALGAADGLGRSILQSAQNLLAFRALSLSIFPLMFAAASLRCSGMRLDRSTLRAPFFSQCYPGGAFAFLVGIGLLLPRFDEPVVRIAGFALLLVSMGWYGFVQHLWFTRIEGQTGRRATIMVAATYALALALILLVGLAVSFA